MPGEARKIALGGREFNLPALTLDQLQEFADDLKQLDALNPAGIGRIRKILAVALTGQVSADELGKLQMTLEDLYEAQVALAEVSGLRPLINRLAEQILASRSAGSNSTPASAPIPAGPGPTSEG